MTRDFSWFAWRLCRFGVRCKLNFNFAGTPCGSVFISAQRHGLFSAVASKIGQMWLRHPLGRPSCWRYFNYSKSLAFVILEHQQMGEHWRTFVKKQPQFHYLSPQQLSTASIKCFKRPRPKPFFSMFSSCEIIIIKSLLKSSSATVINHSLHIYDWCSIYSNDFLPKEIKWSQSALIKAKSVIYFRIQMDSDGQCRRVRPHTFNLPPSLFRWLRAALPPAECGLSN